MFTGIVEGLGRVKSIEKQGSSGKIAIEATLDLSAVNIGDSIAVDGVCLTVTSLSGEKFVADVSTETLNTTTLGGLSPGAGVNLERALTLSKPLGGHLVTGHVDGVGTISSKQKSGNGILLEVTFARELVKQLIKKGSIAIDGISLTVAELTVNGIKAAIIPHTLTNTSLANKGEGEKVNIETDIIGKYVEKFVLNHSEGNITRGFLKDHGFLGGE